MTSALLLCPEGNAGLLGSYGRAFKQLGLATHFFSLTAAIDRHIKFDRVGRAVAKYIPFEPWIVGGNRDLIHEVMARRPEILLFAGAMPVRAGALAQIKVACPGTKIVLAWPDTLLNLSDTILACLPACDLVASYSSTAIPVFERFGARTVHWLPFAIDEELFPSDIAPTSDERAQYGSDVAFIGNYREDREAAVAKLVRAGLDVKVWGSAWDRGRDQGMIRLVHQARQLVGRDSVKAVRSAKATLNVIDPTNYPAANMRFFEQYACAGASLSSPCPEMEDEFPDGECAMYFRNEDELVAKAKQLVHDVRLREHVTAEGRRRGLRAHTYLHRAAKMLELLNVAS